MITIPATLTEFEKNPYWKQKIDPSIKVGVATSDYQVNGAENFKNSTWAQFEGLLKENGDSTIERGEKSGVALDFWHNPEDLIDKLKELGVKDYRFSVEWSAIYPEKGVFFEEAMGKYVYICKRLLQEGIEPLITLHHFSDPIWFKNQGGFEKEENIPDFVDFTKIVYKNLSPFVKNWVTINEPTIYAFQGWFRGVFPPGIKNDTQMVGTVLKHLAMAHIAVFDAIKELDVNGESKIGIAHQVLRFRPYCENNPCESLPCYYLTQITHQCFMDFFVTGEFIFQMPWPYSADVRYSRPDIKDKFDFFAVQYYTDPLISMIWQSTHYDGEKMTYMPFRFYPQGQATVLEECRKLNKPIWITETGAAASPADQKEYIKKALKVASFAKSKGVQIERVYLWTLADNFEWDMGWMERPGFGLYHFDPKTGQYAIRPSGEFVKKLLHLRGNESKTVEGKQHLIEI